MKTTVRSLLLVLLVSFGLGPVLAGPPPNLVNYQGVLRDAADVPLDGTFNMRFRLYDTDGGASCPASGGTLQLTDEHLASGSGGVTVTGGLFNVQIGSGAILPGVWSSLFNVFAVNTDVWLEVEVNGEILCPRTRIASAPYAMNAFTLDGIYSSGFLRDDVAETYFGSGITLNTSAEPDMTLADDRFWINTASDEQFLIWNNGVGQLNLQIDGDLYVGGGSSTDTDRIRFDDFFGNESLVWFDSASRFHISDDFHVGGALRVGNTTNGGATQPYNIFKVGSGTPLPSSGQMVDADDVYIEGNVEMDGDLFVDGVDIHLGTDTKIGVESFNDLIIRKDQDNNASSYFRIFEDANLYEQMRIVNGDEANALFDGTVTSNGLDYAEAFKVQAGSPIEAGDVVGLDPARPEFIVRASTGAVAEAIGVVSAKPGYLTGLSFDAEDAADPEVCAQRDAARARGDLDAARSLTDRLAELARDAHRAVALAGRVPVKVVDRNGPIAAGDRLTTSDVPGHAMRMTGPGPSIGIAIESWDGEGSGHVLTFIQPGWHGGGTLAAATGSGGFIDDGLSASGSTGEDDAAPATTAAATSLVPATAAEHRVTLGRDADGRSRFSVVGSGADGAAARELFRVDERGDVFAKGAFRPASMDVAEYFALSEAVEPGDVLAIDLDSPGRYRLAREAADAKVIGVVSASPGVLLGSDIARIMAADAELAARFEAARAFGDGEEQARLWQQLERRFLATHAAIAMTGTVPVKVDAGYGAVRPGDLLQASPTPGHAMRTDDPLPGTILGKALEGLASGAGKVRVLVFTR